MNQTNLPCKVLIQVLTQMLSKALVITCQLFILVYAQIASAQTIGSDPLENLNRNTYGLNQVLDSYLIKPATKSYQYIIPDIAQRGVSNFFNNLDDVNVVVNDVLQLKLHSALKDTGRFTLNTTLGIGGIFDVATRAGLNKNNEDFGQTLGYWGVESGPYIVLPFFGSKSVRDTVAMIPDLFFNPIHWIDNNKVKSALYVMDTIDSRQKFFMAESMISGDEYRFVRDAYLQRREYLVADGEVYDEFDDF